MSPLAKSTSRTKWQRINDKNWFHYRCPDHMSWLSCRLRLLSFPYSRLDIFLDELDKRALDYYKRELLCLSVHVQQERVELLTITSPKNMPIGSLHILEEIQPLRPTATHRSIARINKQPFWNLLIWPSLANQQLCYNRWNSHVLARRKTACSRRGRVKV